MNKSVRNFGRLDHEYAPEEYLHRIDAQMNFTMREQPLDLVVYNQWHRQKRAYIQCSSSGIGLSWFLRLHENYKNDWCAFCFCF